MNERTLPSDTISVVVVDGAQAVRHDADWDAFVAACSGDTYAQSSAYAAVKRASHETIRLEFRAGGERIAGAQLQTRQLAGIGAIGYVAKGPVFASVTRPRAAAVVDALVVEARRRRVRALVVQPVERDVVLDAALAARGFGPSPVNVATVGTIAVDLRRDEEILLKTMRSALRRNIKKAEKGGVIVREAGRDELELFHRMHLDTASRNGFPPLSFERMSTEWDELAPRGFLRLFLTEIDGAPVSGATVTTFGDRVLFRSAGWFRSDASAALRPNDLLHWEIMRWAKAHGFPFYDFGGFDRDIAAGLLVGVEPPPEFRQTYSQFKLGYGGTPMVLPLSVWRLIPAPARPFQSAVKWAFETIPPAKRALERRHNG